MAEIGEQATRRTPGSPAHDGVSPASATSLEFMKRSRELLGSVTAIPPQLSGQWSANPSQQDEATQLMEASGRPI